jgi:hypothetical protein
MNHRFLIALAALPLLLLSSCASRQEISLNPDGSGEAVVHVTVQKFFSDYLMDLSEFSGSTRPRSAGMFDDKGIRAALEKRPGVVVKAIKVVSPLELELNLAFKNIDDLVRGQKELTDTGIVTFRNDAGTRTLRFHLDQKNFAKIAALVPSSDGSTETILGVFGPQQGVTVTEAEYLETMAFTLGDPGPQGIKDSSITAAVTVNGKLVSQKGGTVKGNTVTFQIPLLKLLILNEPLDYEIVFK